MSRADKQVNPSLDISEHSEGGLTRHRSEGGITLFEHACIEMAKGIIPAYGVPVDDNQRAIVADHAAKMAQALINEITRVSP